MNGERLDFKGEYYQTDSAKLYSPPIHKIPVYLAAGGPQTAILAAKSCDGVIVSVKDIKEVTENVLDVVKASTNKEAFKVIAISWSVYAENDEQAWEAIRAQRGLRAPSRATAGPLELQQEADSLPKSEILGKYHQLRSVNDYVSAYGPLITKLQSDIVGIQTTSFDQLSTINMLGKEVLPQLRKL